MQAKETVALDTEVIIIGAGPAGAGASMYLTKAGVRHIIIEKALFPRDKVCGDACSGKTAFVIRNANPEWIQDIYQQSAGYLPSYGVQFVSPSAKVLEVPYGSNSHPGEPSAGFTSQRLVFDNYLFEKLPSPYASIYQQAAVKELQRLDDGKMQVVFIHDNKTYTATAPIIIGADGDKSIVRKTFMNDAQNEKAQAVALRAYYKGITGLHPDNFIELHYLPELLPGYFWIFALPNGMANVGVGMMSDTVRKRGINLRERMLAAIQNNPNIRDRFANAELVGKIQGWGLAMGMERQPISGDGFLLTGDAASLIDPFSGEGIGNALYSGMLAANAVQAALAAKRNDAAFLHSEYDKPLYHRIGDELRVSAVLQRLCRYPRLVNFVVNKAHKSPTLHRTITGMFTGADLRTQLRKPSFYARILCNR